MVRIWARTCATSGQSRVSKTLERTTRLAAERAFEQSAVDLDPESDLLCPRCELLLRAAEDALPVHKSDGKQLVVRCKPSTTYQKGRRKSAGAGQVCGCDEASS